jgi:hypothetical protein
VERSYSSYSFLTLALDGGEWSALRPGCTLAEGKGLVVPTVQEAGWAPELVWTQRLHENSLASAGDRTLIAWSSSPYPDTILTELPASPGVSYKTFISSVDFLTMEALH